MNIGTATIGSVVDKYIKIFFQLNEESELEKCFEEVL